MRLFLKPYIHGRQEAVLMLLDEFVVRPLDSFESLNQNGEFFIERRLDICPLFGLRSLKYIRMLIFRRYDSCQKCTAHLIFETKKQTALKNVPCWKENEIRIHLQDSIFPNNDTVLFSNADNLIGFFLDEFDKIDFNQESLISLPKWLTGWIKNGLSTLSSRSKRTTHFHIVSLGGQVEASLGVLIRGSPSLGWLRNMST